MISIKNCKKWEKHSPMFTPGALGYMENTADRNGSVTLARPDGEAPPRGSAEPGRRSTCPPLVRMRRFWATVHDVFRSRYQNDESRLMMEYWIRNQNIPHCNANAFTFKIYYPHEGAKWRPRKKRVRAFDFKGSALCWPYSSWNMPSNGAWKLQGPFSQGSFKCFKKPGLIHLHNIPGSRGSLVISKHKKVQVIFLKLHHSELGDLRWEFICSGSAHTYTTDPEDLNRPLETLRVFERESTSLKKGWQIPRPSDPLAEILWPQEVLKEWLFAYSKARQSVTLTFQRCVHTLDMHL